MITIQIAKTTVRMDKFFSAESAQAMLAALEGAKSVLFIDTPATEHLVWLVGKLVENGVSVTFRDHHDVVAPTNAREQAIADAAQAIRDRLGFTAWISSRDQTPACSMLIVNAGEFANVEAVVADPDPDGLMGAMKALGVTYEGLDADAAVMDGAHAARTAENLSPLALLLQKGLATLPPFNPQRPQVSEEAKGALFSQFAQAAGGDQEAFSALESRVAEYEAAVAIAQQLLATKVTHPTEGVIRVDAVGAGKYELTTLSAGLEASGAKITVVRKDTGPIAGAHGGVQYSLAVVKAHQSEIDLQALLPAGYESGPAAGIISNTSFLLHVSEQVWNETILPALPALISSTM